MNAIGVMGKNLKILLRSKVTSASLFLGPLLIILIAGLAFNNSLSYDIQVGTYSENLSELGEQFIRDLKTEFDVTQFQSKDLCVQAVKSRGFHACIEIPPELQIEEGKQNNISFYFDNSRINIVSAIKQSVFKSISGTSQNISQAITGSLLETIEFTEEEITKDRAIIDTEISKKEIILNTVRQSETLLSQSNLEFDKDELDLDDLKKESEDVNKQTSAIKKIAQDALNSYDDTLDDIEDLNITNSNLNTLLNEGDDSRRLLKEKLDNSTAIGASTSELVSLINSLSNNLDDLDESLSDARTNKNSATTNLQTISKEIKASKDKLQETKESLQGVLNAINGQEVRDASAISSPVIISEFEIVAGSKLNHLFPNLIILVIMFVTIITSATQVINEKLNKASQRMSMTPVSTFTNVLATFLTILLITIIQVTLILLLTQFFFKIDVFSDIIQTIAILLFATVFFTLLGIILGNLFNTEHTVMLSAISVSSFFLILSDLILPLESMPESLIEILNYTPFILSTNLLRQVVFFETPISELSVQYYTLIGICVGTLLIIGITSSANAFLKKIVANRRAKSCIKTEKPSKKKKEPLLKKEKKHTHEDHKKRQKPSKSKKKFL